MFGILTGAAGFACLGAAITLEAPLAPIAFLGGLVLLWTAVVILISSSGQTASWWGPIHYR